jgi:hypothetical protein
MAIFLTFKAYSENQSNELRVTLNGQQVALIGGQPLNQWAQFNYDVTSLIVQGGANQLVFTQAANTYNPIMAVDVYAVIQGVTGDIALLQQDANPVTVYGQFTDGIACQGTGGCPVVYNFNAPVLQVLQVTSAPAGVPFTINGAAATTPYVALAPVGSYAIAMPPIQVIGNATYVFRQWQDGSTNSTLQVVLTATTLNPL